MLDNPLILSSLSAMLIAQVLKVLLVLLTENSWHVERFVETGGMPSSHSATMSAIATSSALEHGVGSSYFAITFILGLIVIYDATGVRRAAGRHAEILNELVSEFSHLFDEKMRQKALKTLLGHTYPQVLVGSAIGLGVAFLASYVLSLSGRSA